MSGNPPTAEDVELVARALCSARTSIVSDWNDPPVPASAAEQWRDRFRDEARAVLATLAGRLIPAGGEERTEWAVGHVNGRTEADDEDEARSWLAEAPGEMWLLRRRRWVGPWESSEGSEG